jgi:hypothetical protein
MSAIFTLLAVGAPSVTVGLPLIGYAPLLRPRPT